MVIANKYFKIFGNNAGDDVGQFGSIEAGAYVNTADPEVIHALPAFEEGFNSAVQTEDKVVAIEDINSVLYYNGRQTAYLTRNGIPEWNVLTPYHENSLVRSGAVIYRSTQTEHTGNAVTDTNYWLKVADFTHPAVDKVANHNNILTEYINADQIQINTGFVNDDTNSVYIKVESSLNINMTVEGLGGRATAITRDNDTWYYVWVAYNSTNNTVERIVGKLADGSDVTTDLNANGYTYKKCVGVILTDGSGDVVRIIHYKFSGRHIFKYYNPGAFMDYAGTGGASLNLIITLNAPPLSYAFGMVNVDDGDVDIFGTDELDSPVAIGQSASGRLPTAGDGGLTGTLGVGRFCVRVDSSSECRIRSISSWDYVNVQTRGFELDI